jgi:hypothetical protein
MPSVNLFSRSVSSDGTTAQSALPQLLQTPSGLVILEVQGTLHAPVPDVSEDDTDFKAQPTQTPVGRLVFPFYNPNSLDPESTSWMKRAYLYVGKHQRLTGEVKKLAKPLAVVRKRDSPVMNSGAETEDGTPGAFEELEIAEIVKYKILFASRPEPVGE